MRLPTANRTADSPSGECCAGFESGPRYQPVAADAFREIELGRLLRILVPPLESPAYGPKNLRSPGESASIPKDQFGGVLPLGVFPAEGLQEFQRLLIARRHPEQGEGRWKRQGMELVPYPRPDRRCEPMGFLQDSEGVAIPGDKAERALEMHALLGERGFLGPRSTESSRGPAGRVG